MTWPAAASTAPSMSINPTKVPPTPATLRPICSSMPVIVTEWVSTTGSAFTRRTSSTRLE